MAGAAHERMGPAGCERPLHPDAPQREGTGEIRLETADHAAGFFATRADGHPKAHARRSAVYVRAEATHLSILDGSDGRQRLELIAEQLKCWKATKST
jgi:hypothetical protein